MGCVPRLEMRNSTKSDAVAYRPRDAEIERVQRINGGYCGGKERGVVRVAAGGVQVVRVWGIWGRPVKYLQNWVGGGGAGSSAPPPQTGAQHQSAVRPEGLLCHHISVRTL